MTRKRAGMVAVRDLPYHANIEQSDFPGPVCARRRRQFCQHADCRGVHAKNLWHYRSRHARRWTFWLYGSGQLLSNLLSPVPRASIPIWIKRNAPQLWIYAPSRRDRLYGGAHSLRARAHDPSDASRSSICRQLPKTESVRYYAARPRRATRISDFR